MKRWFIRGDAVFFKCMNPATGRIKRVAKNQSWAEVFWDQGLDCHHVSRVKTKYIEHLNPVLNEHFKRKLRG